MNITLLCSDEKHPVNKYLETWMRDNEGEHQVSLVRQKKDLTQGDILFLISCSEIIQCAERSLYKACLVLHASDLPEGRGWSPHIWGILEGKQEITVSLLEADDQVDAGRIWKKIRFPVPTHALWNEINTKLFEAELSLLDYAVENFSTITPELQDSNIKPTYYSRRKPVDSCIDPDQSIASQFNQIRVCDPERFPAYFDLYGIRYKIILEKV